ncbi:beta-galactosidase [Paenibacillus methanolicus]|uniref:Beta-galactosidase-like protein n=1 Tax=Paenibacillus methanolicus TaxID=582686 RepID=A0A5S5BRE8_9BACL|nr:beta-galactosidase [Paenibacillus methanolicus]TYP69504.1 beta-galactosidase-like protein [Paenibacillus methanolicus]
MSKTIIFYDANFPIDNARPGAAEVETLAKGAVIADADGLAAALRGASGGSFVNLHAPYFPKAAWTAILDYLRLGGGLVSLGGIPFRVPVVRSGDGWTCEPKQTAYHQQLHIHEALKVNEANIERYEASGDIPVAAAMAEAWEKAPTYGLILHVTKLSDHPHEMGTSGPMDGRIYPLLKGITAEGREIAAPIVLLEYARGEFAGSRWMMANQALGERFWQGGGAQAVAEWAAFTARGVTDMWLMPLYASYDEGDHPVLKLQVQALGGSGVGGAGKSEIRWQASLSFRRVWGRTADGATSAMASGSPAGRSDAYALSSDAVLTEPSEPPVWTRDWSVAATDELAIERIRIPVPMTPGYYEAELTLTSEHGERRVLRQGIWCRDDALLAEGSFLTCGPDYFERDGKPVPIVGMTYMTSDVARKFLFLPNASVWDRDMATMKKAGISLIRTGIWTAYRNYMYEDGHASEETLRAIDAFLLTAKRHGLEVTFTFFSFAPEAWEGTNPYLDPRSIAAQKRFLASIVSRHRESKHVHWDLINEPSVFDPKRIFEGPRTAGDPYEQRAFRAWLRERHGGGIEAVQARWNMTPEQLPSFEAVMPPEAEDINFDVQDMRSGKKGTRWLDYSLFAMEMFNRWAREMNATLRELQPRQLITVGQDEALGAQRPTTHFYAPIADYTTNHSWWLNDQLVWDGVFSKMEGKPNLIQETGIMYVETPDGRAKRSEEELRDLLERKYAYAFATGGAGAVQWIWNTNYFMDNVNESNIGALRADGTEKPEADVSCDFGRFMAEIGELFRGRQAADVAVVFPYSNDLGNRRLAAEATSRLTRVLSYGMNVHFRGVGEYQLEELRRAPARLIVVPSPHNFSDEAFDTLMDIVGETGATLLYTGPLGLDAYWRIQPRAVEHTGRTRVANVLREEAFELDGAVVPTSFGQRKIAELCKESPMIADGSGGVMPKVLQWPVGRGRVIWCGLPVELGERTEAIARLYEHALAEAGVKRELEWLEGGDNAGLYGKKLRFADGALYIFVSEYAYPAAVAVRDPEHGGTYRLELAPGRIAMFAAGRDGEIRQTYRRQVIASTLA